MHTLVELSEIFRSSIQLAATSFAPVRPADHPGPLEEKKEYTGWKGLSNHTVRYQSLILGARDIYHARTPGGGY